MSLTILMFCLAAYTNTGHCFREAQLPGRAAFIFAVACLGWLNAVVLKSMTSFSSPHVAVPTAIGLGLSLLVPKFSPTFLLMAALVAIDVCTTENLTNYGVLGGITTGLLATFVVDGLFWFLRKTPLSVLESL